MLEYSSGSKNRDFSKFDNMSTEELEEILRADSQLPDDVNSDTDAILYIMGVIAKREKEHPTGKFTDVHKAWKSFTDYYLPYSNDDKALYDFENGESKVNGQANLLPPSRPNKKSRVMRASLVAAVFSVLLLAGTVTAKAFGLDLWGTIAKWTMETFGYSMPGTTENPAGYISLQDALSKYGVTEPIAPSWIPEGYKLISVDVSETPVKTKFLATYKNNSDELIISVTKTLNRSLATFEKDANEVTMYVAGGIEHYIMTNNGRKRAVWIVDSYECAISGQITDDEIVRMIDSIYER
ncbi:MAG: DUF4367 domain-containing protein [Clostridiales bacterium]|jgi:hypothetical protein|nr:DUF4367 domain-containing protein [Clostridiales bacterium]